MKRSLSKGGKLDHISKFTEQSKAGLIDQSNIITINGQQPTTSC